MGATDGPETTRRPDDNVLETFIAWIVGLGPGSPAGPPEIETYQAIRRGTEKDCRDAANTPMIEPETETLYHGAAAACLAALNGKKDQWVDAERALAALNGPPQGCLDLAVYNLLKSALDAHHAAPNAEFTLQGTPDKGEPEQN